jgi:hypothetical protein
MLRSISLPIVGLAALSTAVCVLVFETYDVTLPYWSDAARGELLAAAMALQYILIALITTFHLACGPQFRMAWVLTESLLITWPLQGTCIVVVLAFVIHLVFGRIALRGRVFIVVALLLALGLAVALIPSPIPAHCLDGG